MHLLKVYNVIIFVRGWASCDTAVSFVLLWLGVCSLYLLKHVHEFLCQLCALNLVIPRVVLFRKGSIAITAILRFATSMPYRWGIQLIVPFTEKFKHQVIPGLNHGFLWPKTTKLVCWHKVCLTTIAGFDWLQVGHRLGLLSALDHFLVCSDKLG